MTSFADDIATSETASDIRDVDVLVSYEVVKLFSEQLYTTPVKAVEELVVNSWDAAATICSVLVDTDGAEPVIAVFDDGSGMTVDELENLWHIGVSGKSKAKSERKLIGKFGIGKLASYSVARRATYVSKANGEVNAVAIDFEDFAQATSAAGVPSPVTLKIRSIDSVAALLTQLEQKSFDRVLHFSEPDPAGPELPPLPVRTLDLEALDSWTLVILEDLKPKSSQLATGRLRWVLETAMPLASDFVLNLNSELVTSSKLRLKRLAEFDLSSLDPKRIDGLNKKMETDWHVEDGAIVSSKFPSGVRGVAYVTERSLYTQGGKSEDLGRSHGFFVRVHDRLINETDPLFGATPLSYQTWNFFAAEVHADDLNPFITAARDDVEQSDMKAQLRALLVAVFYQARDLADEAKETKLKQERVNKEGHLDYVSTSLVEKPLADAIAETAEALVIKHPASSAGAVEDEPQWRYLEPVGTLEEAQSLVEQLYTDRRSEKRYTFRYAQLGRAAPLASLNAATATFSINEDHEFAIEFGADATARRALEAMAAAEVMLEVYLSQTRLPIATIQQLLDVRDTLLRSLARDHGLSLTSLAQELRDSSADDVALEIALVGALRALGFSAKHVGGPGTPDGVASYVVQGTGSKSFTIEAKSSKQQPQLSQLDFAGLRSHFESEGAAGCLLVAPTYPGGLSLDSEVSKRARQQGVSCWTIDQLARVVSLAEDRHINATQLQEIVLGQFDPASVTAAVDALLATPTFTKTDLYGSIIAALRDLETRLPDAQRDISLIAGEVSRNAHFSGILMSDVRDAIEDLARASRGMLNLSQDNAVQVLGSIDELERRVATLAQLDGKPRRLGSFRADGVE
jgi:hypothetical protein